MNDIDRKRAEKLIEIDKIKNAKNQSVAGMYMGVPLGIFMLILYVATYPSSFFLIFAIMWFVLSLAGYYDLNYLFPRRLAKAEAEYEAMKNLVENEVLDEN